MSPTVKIARKVFGAPQLTGWPCEGAVPSSPTSRLGPTECRRRRASTGRSWLVLQAVFGIGHVPMRDWRFF